MTIHRTKNSNSPILQGYGSYKSEEEDIVNAIKAGYRYIDSAVAYKNHVAVGNAVKNSGLDRGDFFIATKIFGFFLEKNNLVDSMKKLLETSLEELRMDQVEILYLHAPDIILPEILDLCMEFKKEKLTLHIGLSNVNAQKLQIVLDRGYEISAIQNEFNPYFWEKDLLDLCNKKKIDFVGYRPFCFKELELLFADNTLNQLANELNTNLSSLILLWMQQKK